MNVQESLELCYEEALKNRAENTARAYKNGLSKFTEYLEEKNIRPPTLLNQLNIEHFIYYPGWMLRQNFTRKTIGVYLSSVRYYLNWLIVQGEMQVSYSDGIRLDMANRTAMQKREKKLPRTPDRGAVDQMLKAVRIMNEPSPRHERDIALVLFLYSSGCRNNEAVQLDIRDLNMVDRSAIVVGKGDKERRIFFSPEAAEALHYYWKVRGFTDGANPVFARHDRGAGKKCKRITTMGVRNVIDQVSKTAGVEFVPHQFRHAFAKKMLMDTGNLALVQDLLGHASPISTRVYTQVDEEDLRQAHRDVFK